MSSTRDEIASGAAEGLARFQGAAAETRVVVGFDGFVDSIIDVVETRHGPEQYEAVPTIARFAEKVAAAAGQSSNYELVTRQQKLGGNGPIMANALVAMGFRVCYIGNVGDPVIHPAFESFAGACEACYAIGDPGYTDALEFHDGKLMLGKLENIRRVSAESLREKVGTETLRRIVGGARLLGMVNWTMLLKTNEIWAYLCAEVFPGIDWNREPVPFIFVDLADPEKRLPEALAEAMEKLRAMGGQARVVLGLNLKEAGQVARVLGVATPSGEAEADWLALAGAIHEALGIHAVVVHPRTGAAAVRRGPGGTESAAFCGPYVQDPRLSTGAGDNFNAGFCLGLMAGLTLEEALCVGTATSGAYVREAKSPSIDRLIEFCRALPPPE